MQKAAFAIPSGEMCDQNFRLLEKENLYFPAFPPMPTGILHVEKFDNRLISEAKKREKEEYTKKCKMWEDLAQTGIMYPVPLSLSIHIPAHHQIITNSTRSVNPKTNPPLSAANLELFNQLLSSDDIVDQTVPGYKNVPTPMTEFIRKDSHWGSKLIPFEPDPNLFPDYDSFKRSLKKWAHMVPCDEVQDSADLVQYGLPLTDHQTQQNEVPKIRRTPRTTNSFNPESFARIDQSKPLELYDKKRYFIKSTFFFFFDRKYTMNERNDIEMKTPPMVNKGEIISNFESGTFECDKDTRLTIKKITNFNNLSTVNSEIDIPNTLGADFHQKLKYMLLNSTKGNEFSVFNYVRQLYEKFPNQLTPILCLDPNITPVVRVAELFVNYGFLNINLYQYEKLNDSNMKIDDLTIFLFGLQTLNVLKQYFTRDKSKRILDQINKQQSTLLSGVHEIIKKHFNQIEPYIANPTGVYIVHLLLDFCPSELANSFSSLIKLLGQVNSREFGHLAAHIWTISGQTSVFMKNFIENSTSYIKSYRSLIANTPNQADVQFPSFRKTCLLISFLLKFEINTKLDINADSIMAMLGAVNQLASVEPLVAAPLASAICKFFSINLSTKSFNTMKENFMNSIMAIFEFPKLDKDILLELFDYSINILITCSYETFTNFFNQTLIKNMTSSSNRLSRGAWNVFRCAASCDFAKKIGKDSAIKGRLLAINVEELSVPAKAVLLLILKKSIKFMPPDEKNWKAKNMSIIANIFSSVDPQVLITSIQHNNPTTFPIENKIVQFVSTGK